MAGLDHSVVETVSNRIWSRTSTRFPARGSELLPYVDLSLQPLRRKGRHIQAVVIEDRVDQLELVAIEKLRDLVAHKSSLLQTTDVRLERQGLVAPSEVEAGHIKFNARAYTRLALRCLHSGGKSRLEFQPRAIGERVTLGFANLHQHILLRIG